MLDLYHLKYVNGHYEVFCGNEFVCSADSWTEAFNEISAMQR